MELEYVFHVDQDLAEVLCEQHNGYAMYMEEIAPLEPEWVLEKLLAVYDPEDLKFLIEDDYGRGLVMGNLHTLLLLESTPDEPEDDAP